MFYLALSIQNQVFGRVSRLGLRSNWAPGDFCRRRGDANFRLLRRIRFPKETQGATVRLSAPRLQGKGRAELPIVTNLRGMLLVNGGIYLNTIFFYY